jgi:hypothetical protein
MPYSDTGRVACTYARWVHAGAAGAPHLGIPLPTRVHQDLIRLRVTSAPLRVMTGTFEGAGHRGIPYAERVCKMCACSCPCCIVLPPPVEDLRHLLFECPAYGHIRTRWPGILPHVPEPSPPATTLVVRGAPTRCPRGFDVTLRRATSPDACPAAIRNQQGQSALAYALYQVLAHRNRVLNMS